MSSCPCCSNLMLSHFRHHKLYWFCRSCWQEMPLLEQKSTGQMQPFRLPQQLLKLETQELAIAKI